MGGKNRKRKDRGKERKTPNVKNNKGIMSLATKISIGTLVSVSLVFLAYFYNQHQTNIYLSKLDDTFLGLLKEESSVSVDVGTKVAIGFGSCQDIIVQSREVVFDQPPKVPEHFYSISNKEEFLKVFSYFYRHGAAAE